ncbi:MAG: hypothetical protein EXR69_11915 [Myxococcales bacterium]|nr:hypothetical protein [Myxococcales bacterium]
MGGRRGVRAWDRWHGADGLDAGGTQRDARGGGARRGRVRHRRPAERRRALGEPDARVDATERPARGLGDLQRRERVQRLRAPLPDRSGLAASLARLPLPGLHGRDRVEVVGCRGSGGKSHDRRTVISIWGTGRRAGPTYSG